jgi:hypothetical protein
MPQMSRQASQRQVIRLSPLLSKKMPTNFFIAIVSCFYRHIMDKAQLHVQWLAKSASANSFKKSAPLLDPDPYQWPYQT